jgi:hypothetical protein
MSDLPVTDEQVDVSDLLQDGMREQLSFGVFAGVDIAQEERRR